MERLDDVMNYPNDPVFEAKEPEDGETGGKLTGRL